MRILLALALLTGLAGCGINVTGPRHLVIQCLDGYAFAGRAGGGLARFPEMDARCGP